MSKIDAHWVIRNSSAQAELERQGYQPDPHARGRKGWVLMVKDITERE